MFWQSGFLLCLQVERGSPKSCFLFLGEVLCEVNWVSVLSDHLQTPPTSTTYPTLPDMGTQKESHTMLVYLLYMLVFLAKEEQLLSQQVSPEHFGFILGSDFFLFFIYSFFFLLPLQLPGFASAQSVGPIHLTALAPTGPVLIPGHSGICQHPLPSHPPAQCWFCASVAAEITAQCCWAPPPP